MPEPAQGVVLVVGALVLCCWRHLVSNFQAFDALGAVALLQVWSVLAACILAGHCARMLCRTQPLRGAPLRWCALHCGNLASALGALPGAGRCLMGASAAVAALAAAWASPGAHYALQQQLQRSSSKDGHKGSEARAQGPAEAASLPAGRSGCGAASAADGGGGAGLAAAAAAAAAADGADDCVDDVTAQKLRAQAAAVTKLAVAQARAAELLGSLGASASLRGAAASLRELAQLALDEAAPVEAVLQPAALRSVVALLPRCCSALEAPGGAPDTAAGDALPAALQASWVLLLAAHDAACRASLARAVPLPHLARLMRALLRPAAGPAAVREAAARSAAWVAAVLCGRSGAAGAAAAGAAAGAPATAAAGAATREEVEAFSEAGGVAAAGQLLAMGAGASPAWAAATLLARVAADGASPSASAAALDAALSPSALRGAARLLCDPPPPGAPRAAAAAAAPALLAALLDAAPTRLVCGLLEARLTGAVAAALQPRLAHRLVCALLSSSGQATLADVEAEYELDVPLALASIIPLPVHIKLPPAPAPPPPGGGAGAAAAAAAAAADDAHTDMLACRLLLQRERLQELVGAFFEELTAAGGADGGEGGAGSGGAAAAAVAPTSAVEATAALFAHLLARESDLQLRRPTRGASLPSSSSDAEGLGADWGGEVEPCGGGEVEPCGGGEVEPCGGGEVEPCGGGEVEPCGGGEDGGGGPSGDVVLRYGAHECRVGPAALRQLRVSSKLMRQLLASLDAARVGAGGAAAGDGVAPLLAVPGRSDEGNAWAVGCLARWAESGSLPPGLSPSQAAELWVAADFVQLNALQEACVDYLTAAAADEGGGADAADAADALDTALRLCADHPLGAQRLLRGAGHTLLQRLAAAGAPAPVELARAAAPHARLLAGWLLSELRDRLVALVTLNAGLDADLVDDPAE